MLLINLITLFTVPLFTAILVYRTVQSSGLDADVRELKTVIQNIQL